VDVVGAVLRPASQCVLTAANAISCLCWSASFYPQPILNYRRRSTHGLAIDYPTINVLGFVCYTISTSCFLFSPLVRRQYAARNPLSPQPTVRFNDLAFAAHGFVMTLIAYSQFWNVLWGFQVGERQRVSKPVAGIFCGCLLAVVVVIMTVWAKGMDAGSDASGWAWIDAVSAPERVSSLTVEVMSNWGSRSMPSATSSSCAPL